MAIELFDRVQRLFARGGGKAAAPDLKTPAKLQEELARNALTILSRWTAPARSYNPDDDLIGIKGMEIYEKMRHDDQVKAALAFKKSAVLSTGWSVEPASNKKADTDAADFVTWCLENLDPLYGSMDDIFYEQLSALDFGFSIAELVLKKLEEGPFKNKIGLRTIKVRKPHEFVFDVDEFDNLKPDGIRQSWMMTGKGMPIDKFLIFSYQREFGNFRGVSDLRAAYRGWWLKDNLWSWVSTYAERFAIPLRTATYPPGTYPEGHPMRALISAVYDALDNLQANTALAFPSDFQIQFHEASGQGVNVLKALFDHCNLSITRSILMPSQLGFSAEGSVGSYARSKVQFDAFMLIIDDLRRDLAEDVINGQLIPRLVGWNYGGLDVLPKFDWLPFTESDEINLMNAWMLATQYGLVTPTPEDETHIRAITKFPEREIPADEEKALKLKNEAAVKKITDQANAVLHPPKPRAPRATPTGWGQSPDAEWGAGWGGGNGGAAGGGEEGAAAGGEEGAASGGGWGGGEYAAADPEFESKHPRGEGGKFAPKPGSYDEFEQQALTNLGKLSRTAKGVSDTSSSKDKPKLVTEGAELAARADKNFRDAIHVAWAAKDEPLRSADEVEALVTKLAETVSRGLLPEGASIWRQHETDPKFGQASVAELPLRLGAFYETFAALLSDPGADPVSTAAWVERIFDAQIHGLADGSGRTTKLLSALVLARAGLPQPNYPDKKTYYTEINKSAAEWEQYYRSLLPRRPKAQRLRDWWQRVNAPQKPPWTSEFPIHAWMDTQRAELYALRYAADPDFETLHPRDPRGQWMDKPMTGIGGPARKMRKEFRRVVTDIVFQHGDGTMPQWHYDVNTENAWRDPGTEGHVLVAPQYTERVLVALEANGVLARVTRRAADTPEPPGRRSLVSAIQAKHDEILIAGPITKLHAQDPEFEQKHPRGQPENKGQFIQKPGGADLEPVGTGDHGVAGGPDALRNIDPRTQPHEYAKSWSLALAAAGENRDKIRLLVEMLPPELRELLTPTNYKYTDENGVYTPERAALHERIIQKYMDAYTPDAYVARARSEEHIRPTLLVLAGGTGAGKSTTLDLLKGKTPLGVEVGADDIKMKDLSDDWNRIAQTDYWEATAGALHEESSYIAKKLLDRALAAKQDIVYDATLRNLEKAQKLIDRAKNHGYRVELLYVDADKDLALQRAEIRANESKRWVPPNFASVSHDQAPKAFREYAPLLDRWMVYRSGQTKEEKPRRLAAAGEGQHISVEQEDEWERFITKMGGRLPSTAVHSRTPSKPKSGDSDGGSPKTRSAKSGSTSPRRDSTTTSSSSTAKSSASDDAAPRTVDFALTADTLDALEADVAQRLRGTIKKTLDALQSVVSKKIQAGDLSFGFIKALDLKHRAEMTAAVREFLAQTYRSGRDHGAALRPATYRRRTHRTPQGLPPEKALQFFDEKSLWITGVLKQRLLDDAKAILYNAIKGDTNVPAVLLQLREVFDPWLGDETAIDPEKQEQVMPYRLETILRTNATEAYNEGLKDSMEDLVESGYVIAFRSSAVLDDRTTNLCEFLHDKCFRPSSEELEAFTPPRHYNCRSMLVPVTQDEGPVEFITPAEIGEAMEMMPPNFGGRQRG